MAKIVVMAGGTGGHIFPALSVARILEKKGCQIVWLGSRHSMESELVPDNGFDGEWISVKGVRGKGVLAKLMTPIRLLVSLTQAFSVLRKHQPAAVLGMGGFASGPGGLAAWLMRLPLVIHEQNAVPGTTNRILARLANGIYCAFPNSFDASFKAKTVGNPVREDIIAIPLPEQRWQSRAGAMRVLVLGGSQGALSLNQYVPEELQRLQHDVEIQAGAQVGVQVELEVWHQTGRNGYGDTETAYSDANFKVKLAEFIDDMAAAYAWADIAICRAGALTVSELSAAGLGAILVPFPFAIDDHQTANAQHMVDVGAAFLLPQSKFRPGALAMLLARLHEQPDTLQAMAMNARQLARPRAAQQVAERCMHFAERGAV